MGAMNEPQHPRIRDLPEVEQDAFRRALIGQTCPTLEGVPDEEQDAYYQSDYDDWKSGRPAAD